MRINIFCRGGRPRRPPVIKFCLFFLLVLTGCFTPESKGLQSKNFSYQEELEYTVFEPSIEAIEPQGKGLEIHEATEARKAERLDIPRRLNTQEKLALISVGIFLLVISAAVYLNFLERRLKKTRKTRKKKNLVKNSVGAGLASARKTYHAKRHSFNFGFRFSIHPAYCPAG